ncbi:MAG TPA: formate dehydrogenase accessory sulfurtransferase FdhD [Ktedonobacterales bacterium]|nr:formate dehydrogenase accessory sulfurtransferase FdhD [Ktedonobacterales bacterium]
METPTRSRLDALRQVTAAVDRWRGDDRATTADELVAEEPLEVRARARVDARASVETIAVIMRTPGHDHELAAGFLFSEGLLRARDELAELVPGADPDGLPSDNVMDVVAAPGVDIVARMREAGYSRQFAVNASCGVCGKNSVAAACATLPPLPLGGLTVDHDILYGLPDRLRAEQRVFAHTGGLHAAGIFDRAGNLLALREDVGRHNAVDKLVGRALLDGTLPMDERILLVSGRLSFEIVLKALAAGIPIVAAVSAPSSLAVDMAQAGGVTLTGFLRGATVNVYTHPERVH